MLALRQVQSIGRSVQRLRRSVIRTLLCALSFSNSIFADDSIMPISMGGNLGYLYNYTRATAGTAGQTTQLTGQVNMNSYIWQPWLAQLGASGTLGYNYSAVERYNSDSKLGSYNVNFGLFPSSRFPFSLTMIGSDDLTLSSGDLFSGNIDRYGIGNGYRVRYLGAKQSIIGRGGDRLDAWYFDRFTQMRDRVGTYDRDLTYSTFNSAAQTEKTFGASYKGRLKNHNFDITGARQTFESSTFKNVNENDSLVLMHHFLPTVGNYYLKTLASYNNQSNRLRKPDCSTCGYSNGAYYTLSSTVEEQVSSFFYWRPEYRPFSLTGTMRLQQRVIDPDGSALFKTNDEQRGGFGSLATNYEITRRLRLSGSVNVSGLDTERGNTASSTQNVSAMYQSDVIFFNDFNYNYYADVVASNRTASEYDVIKLSESIGGGVGHGANRRWVTGNRSSLRLSLQQGIRVTLGMHDETSPHVQQDFTIRSRKFVFEEPGTSLSHTASITWSDDLRTGGSSLAQISMLDSRVFENNLSTQLINLQLSHTFPVSRVSSFNANGSMQSTRRVTGDMPEKSLMNEFVSTASGRLSYQHDRLFGIYKLNFRSRLDAYTSLNRGGGDRAQADWENRIGYAVGKLSSSFMYRHVFSSTGLGVYTLLFSLNRSF